MKLYWEDTGIPGFRECLCELKFKYEDSSCLQGAHNPKIRQSVISDIEIVLHEDAKDKEMDSDLGTQGRLFGTLKLLMVEPARFWATETKGEQEWHKQRMRQKKKKHSAKYLRDSKQVSVATAKGVLGVWEKQGD